MELRVDHKSYVPLHIQIETLLRELIKAPEYSKGKFLPNEVALASTLGISRSTVRAGINKLVYDGTLERKKGVGTKLVQQKTRISSQLKSWISFTKEMQEQGIKVQTFHSEFKKVKIPKEVKEAFSLKETIFIGRLERVKGYDDTPIIHSLSYFHPRIELTGKEDFTRPLYDILENDFHITAENSFEKITAVCADEHLSMMMKIEKGFPLLCRERVVSDPGGRYIEYNIHHQRTDKAAYTINIQRG